LAWRTRQAQGRAETVRIRLVDGTQHTDRIERIATTEARPEQSDETLVLTMAGGQAIRLAEIELIAAPRRSSPSGPLTALIRGSRPTRTSSAIAATA